MWSPRPGGRGAGTRCAGRGDRSGLSVVIRIQPRHHGPVSNLPVRGPQEKAALPTGPPLRVRHHRTSGPVLRLPRAARTSRPRRYRPAGPAGSQPWPAAPSGHRRAPRPSRNIIETARPQTPAHAEVRGAHQGPQGSEATEPLGANFHHQPAHGAAHMSNETAGTRGGIPVNHGREDVNERDRLARDLTAARERTLALVDLDDDELRRQYHPLMSPLGGDLAPIGQQEELWLLRDGDPDRPSMLGAQVESLYDAFIHSRASRVDLPLMSPAGARTFCATVRDKALDALDALPDREHATFPFALIVSHEQQ